MRKTLSSRLVLISVLLLCVRIHSAEVEVGKVEWGRNLAEALRASSESGKPVLVLFQEVPGCAGCQQFGREVLSHPQIVEAIESEFEPVLVYNNRPGDDAELLRDFGEPAWNYQVIRFLDQHKEDLIPRKDRIWTVEALAARMSEALVAVGREVPVYLKALGGVASAKDPAEAAFAMFCFWTGELRLGGIEGVLTTEAGWIGGREVTRVTYDRAVLSFEKLLRNAASFDCAQKVYVTGESDFKISESSRLQTGKLDESYRRANVTDQKRQISGTVFQELNLSPVQATKINALARTNPESALQWLSPLQREKITNS